MVRIVESLLSAVLLSSILSFGQSSAFQVSKTPFEIFGGYSRVSADFTGTYRGGGYASQALNGWDASFTFRPHRVLGVEADFSGFSSSYTLGGISPFTDTARSESFLFGPNVSVPISRVTPFAHFLIGTTHIGVHPGCGPLCVATSTNNLSYALGGGIDFFFTQHVGVRGQADFFHNGYTNGDNQLAPYYKQKTARVSTGIVFRF